MDRDAEVLEHFLHVFPLLNNYSINELGVVVTDREKYLLFKPGKGMADVKIPPGTPLKPGTAVLIAMNENRRVVMRGDKATFGLPYIACAYPIYGSHGKVIGGAVLLETVDKQDVLNRYCHRQCCPNHRKIQPTGR